MKYVLLILFLLLNIVVCNCSSKEKGNISDSNMIKMRGEVSIITIDGRFLSDNGTYVQYKPGRYKKRAKYETWNFSIKGFTNKVGDYKKIKKVTVKIMTLKTKKNRYKPQNEMMQSPIGGFLNVTHFCTILKVIR